LSLKSTWTDLSNSVAQVKRFFIGNTAQSTVESKPVLGHKVAA